MNKYRVTIVVRSANGKRKSKSVEFEAESLDALLEDSDDEIFADLNDDIEAPDCAGLIVKITEL